MSAAKGQGTVLLVDNGAGRIKYGYGVHGDKSPKGTMPNCMAHVSKQMQVLIGDEVDSIRTGALLQYSRPFDRGYVTNWHCEIEVWTRLFGTSSLLPTSPGEASLVVTEPPFSPEPIQNDMNEVIFEYFGFKEYMRRPAAWFSAYEFSSNPPAGTTNPSCCLIVDSGFSFTHAMPFIGNKCKKAAVKRVDVGGKLLTNYLKEIVSYRQWNMMDEIKLMNQVKEELCYVSTDFVSELSAASRAGVRPGRSRGTLTASMGGSLKKLFVLPDYQSIMTGFVRDDDAPDNPGEQVLTMETERFTVPEVLFYPSDVGMEQMGISEAAWSSIRSLSLVEQGLVAANIVLCGGNAKLPQIQPRFYSEIRQLVPEMFPVTVHNPLSPDEFAYNGMARFVDNERRAGTLGKHMVTKSEYMERGNRHCNEKFYSGW